MHLTWVVWTLSQPPDNLNTSQTFPWIPCIYLTHPSGKEATGSVWKRGFKKLKRDWMNFWFITSKLSKQILAASLAKSHTQNQNQLGVKQNDVHRKKKLFFLLLLMGKCHPVQIKQPLLQQISLAAARLEVTSCISSFSSCGAFEGS